MAKKVIESSDIQGTLDDSIVLQESFEVLCEKGDFIHNQCNYNHHFLSLEDAKRLIDEGYEYIKIITT